MGLYWSYTTPLAIVQSRQLSRRSNVNLFVAFGITSTQSLKVQVNREESAIFEDFNLLTINDLNIYIAKRQWLWHFDMHYIPRSVSIPDDSFFLFGPRGTGKSTWIAYSFPTAFRIDLLNGEQERLYTARPERILDDVKALPDGSVFCIDEIQRVPALLPMIHMII